METVSLDNVLRNIYDDEVAFIRKTNIELEREHFSTHNIPLGEIMQGASYEDHFRDYKRAIKSESEHGIEQMFMILREYFLFSNGYDMMFKKKLEADLFTSVPMEDLLYPMLEAAVKEKYNDISVMRENPNVEKNIKGIAKIVDRYMDMQSLLYLLYCSDFQFQNGWEGICREDTAKDVLEALKSSGMTIGDFLHALIDDKCKIIGEILSEITDPALRKKYLEKLEELRNEKQEETKEFAHVDLPITYFLDHTFLDFINMERKSPILAEDKPKVAQKLYIPSNPKEKKGD